MKKVGMPRGLFYYYLYPLWKTFFNDLGAQVILSNRTTRLTMDQGIELAVDEACLPIKVYFGHVKELCNYQLDYIFIPRVVSIENRSYICPKFMGIPDMVRAAIPGLPPIIDTTIDLSKTERLLKQDIIRVGKLFTNRPAKIHQAYQHAREELRFCRALAGNGYTLAEAISLWEGEKTLVTPTGDLTVGVLGHGYSLYDQLISMDIIERLRNMGVRVCLPESLPHAEVEYQAGTMPKRVFWTLGRKMVGSAFYMDQNREIDGIIYLACFGCGPDSLIGEIIERKVTQKPFMLVTVDEHTGEGGLVTRLEAFCDMLRYRRRQKGENNLSPHG